MSESRFKIIQMVKDKKLRKQAVLNVVKARFPELGTDEKVTEQMINDHIDEMGMKLIENTHRSFDAAVELEFLNLKTPQQTPDPRQGRVYKF